MKQITTFTIISLSLPMNISVPPRGPMGNKKSEKCHELSRNQYKKLLIHPTPGGGVPRGIGGGVNISKVREMS